MARKGRTGEDMRHLIKSFVLVVAALVAVAMFNASTAQAACAPQQDSDEESLQCRERSTPSVNGEVVILSRYIRDLESDFQRAEEKLQRLEESCCTKKKAATPSPRYNGPTRAQLQKRIEKLEGDLQGLKTRLDGATTTREELEGIRNQLIILEGRVDALELRVNALEKAVKEAKADAKKAQEGVDELKARYQPGMSFGAAAVAYAGNPVSMAGVTALGPGFTLRGGSVLEKQDRKGIRGLYLESQVAWLKQGLGGTQFGFSSGLYRRWDAMSLGAGLRGAVTELQDQEGHTLYNRWGLGPEFRFGWEVLDLRVAVPIGPVFALNEPLGFGTGVEISLGVQWTFGGVPQAATTPAPKAKKAKKGKVKKTKPRTPRPKKAK